MYIKKEFKLRSIKEAKDLKGKRVLVRVDFNLPLGRDGKVNPSQDWKLVRALPTIDYLVSQQARIILTSHLGRPHGKWDNKLTLRPVAKRAEKLLGKKITFDSTNLLLKWPEQAQKLKNGEILFLENVRFYPGEIHYNRRFTRRLASLGEVYVNDAFAVDHHPAASTLWVSKFLPSYAGLTVLEEVKHLEKLRSNPKRPFVLVVGGAKIAGKLELITEYLPRVDFLLVGGGIANTIFSGLGYHMGDSLVDHSIMKMTMKLIRKHHFSILKDVNPRPDELVLPPSVLKYLKGKELDGLKRRVILPIDVKVLDKRENHVKVKEVSPDDKQLCEAGETVLDIGPGTRVLYEQIIKRAGAILWNGPMGKIEDPRFTKGTFSLAKAIAQTRAQKIVGGGDSVEVVERLKLQDKMSFISTGGGALLEFLLDGTLHCFEPLVK